MYDECVSHDCCELNNNDYQLCGVHNYELLEYLDEVDPITPEEMRFLNWLTLKLSRKYYFPDILDHNEIIYPSKVRIGSGKYYKQELRKRLNEHPTERAGFLSFVRADD